MQSDDLRLAYSDPISNHREENKGDTYKIDNLKQSTNHFDIPKTTQMIGGSIPNPGPQTSNILMTENDDFEDLPSNVTSKHPKLFKCANCGIKGVTVVSRKIGHGSWVLCGALTCFGCLPFSFLPLCLDDCQDAYHQCPSCGNPAGLLDIKDQLYKREDHKYEDLEYFSPDVDDNFRDDAYFKSTFDAQTVKDIVANLAEGKQFEKLYGHLVKKSQVITTEMKSIARDYFLGTQARPIVYKRNIRDTKISRLQSARVSVSPQNKDRLLNPKGNISFQREASYNQETAGESVHESTYSPYPKHGEGLVLPKIYLNGHQVRDASRHKSYQPDDNLSKRTSNNSEQYNPALFSNPFFQNMIGKARMKSKRLLVFNFNPETPEFDKFYRKLTGDEKSIALKQIKLPRDILRKYLLKRYPAPMIDRFFSYMEFPSVIDFRLYKEIFNRILNESMDFPYFLCYLMFDINQDDFFCSRDLFQIYKFVEHYPVLEKDFKKLFSHRFVTPTNQKPIRGHQRTRSQTTKQTPREFSALGSPHERKSPEKRMKLDKKLMRRPSIFRGLEELLMKKEKLLTYPQQKLLQETDFKTFPNFKPYNHRFRTMYEMIEGSSTKLAQKQKFSDVVLKLTDVLRSRRESLITESIDFQPEWKDAMFDYNGFIELFADDLPHILYDMLFYLGLIEFPHHPVKLKLDDLL